MEYYTQGKRSRNHRALRDPQKHNNKSLDTKLTRKDTDLLICLQNIHDYASVDSWYEELEDLAVLTFAKTLEDLGVEA